MMHVSYPELDRVLQSADSQISAAEGHGCLCGALCAIQDYDLKVWVEEIVPDDARTSDADREALRLAFSDTVRALREDQMEFTPLLPEDETALEARASALAEWCQGFLYGLGLSGVDARNRLPDNVDEILRDLTQISQASVDPEALDEEGEESYVELVEYLRAGVQLIHDELSAARMRN
jgi:uncharacterized protein YgfB (UPF0149 family)